MVFFCYTMHVKAIIALSEVGMQVHKDQHEIGCFIHLSCLSTHMPTYVIFLYGQHIAACFLSYSLHRD